MTNAQWAQPGISYTVLRPLDLQHVQRIIFVGDPNRLPPIGAGRPCADRVGTLRKGKSSNRAEVKARGAAMAESVVLEECATAFLHGAGPARSSAGAGVLFGGRSDPSPPNRCRPPVRRLAGD